MRLLAILLLAGVLVEAPAGAACRQVDGRWPDRWAKTVERSADLIIDASVVGEEDASHGIAARLRPITVYKGSPPAIVAMALPPDDGLIVTERYQGFPAKLGDRALLMLYSSPAGFVTRTCDYPIDRPPFRQALLDRLARHQARMSSR